MAASTARCKAAGGQACALRAHKGLGEKEVRAEKPEPQRQRLSPGRQARSGFDAPLFRGRFPQIRKSRHASSGQSSRAIILAPFAVGFRALFVEPLLKLGIASAPPM